MARRLKGAGCRRRPLGTPRRQRSGISWYPIGTSPRVTARHAIAHGARLQIGEAGLSPRYANPRFNSASVADAPATEPETRRVDRARPRNPVAAQSLPLFA